MFLYAQSSFGFSFSFFLFLLIDGLDAETRFLFGAPAVVTLFMHTNLTNNVKEKFCKQQIFPTHISQKI